MTTRPAAWPFLYSVTKRGIVRNGPPAATTPQPKQRQQREKKAAPTAEGARW